MPSPANWIRCDACDCPSNLQAVAEGTAGLEVGMMPLEGPGGVDWASTRGDLVNGGMEGGAALLHVW